ncbi:MAG TPA: MFS transporter, partial [bacterium]|nr:MFS transporter [bacterium]
WWGLFSIPLFRHVPEPAGQGKPAASSIFRESLIRLKETFSDIRRYRPAFLFILAFWFYNDGIGTIIKMATVYGSEIGIGTLDLVGALLLTQFVGIPCSLLFGRIAGRVGAKRAILAGIGVYGLISLGGFLMASALHFWILAFVVGLVQGGTQALSRSYYAVLIPKDKSAEFFSFYNISGKFAGILGPALFGLINQLSGNSRLGILSLLFFFITGGILLWRVPDPAGPGSRDTRLHPD